MDNIWIQLIITGGTALSAAFGAYKYSVNQSAKREKIFLDYIKDMQKQELEYYEKKNGHLERISTLFSKTIDKNTRALDKLSARIKDDKKNA